MDPKDSFNYKYHKWDYISSPHLLLEENQVQKIKSSHGLIYKFLGDNKDNLFICDESVGEELYNAGIWIPSKCWQNKRRNILITSKM